MKVRQTNGDAPRINNYCTAREYEVFVLIAKNEEYKAGDTISGETLKNKTIGREWKITECDRRDGGRVTIIDNKGNLKTLVFADGTPGTTKETTTTKETNNETKTTTNETTNETNNETTTNETKETNDMTNNTTMLTLNSIQEQEYVQIN